MARKAPVQDEINFSLVVRDLRQKLGLTQAEMALKLKVSCTTLSGWETDRHRPMRVHASRIVDLARRAGVLEATGATEAPRRLPAVSSTASDTPEPAAEGTAGAGRDEVQEDEEQGSLIDNRTGWPRKAAERRDFYHRPREFPPDVSVWRKQLVATIQADPSLNPRAAARSPEELRELVDEVTSALREVAEIASVLYGNPTLGNMSDPVDGLDAAVGRVLQRLGIHRRLGLKLESLNHKQLLRVLPDLVPPCLRRNLHVNLLMHGRQVCTATAPKCSDCDLRKFCQYYRKQAQEAAEREGAPTVVDLFCGAGGLSEGFRRSGFRVIGAVDNNSLALRTFALNHPEVPQEAILEADLAKLSAEDLRKATGGRQIDVLIGAPPCQGFAQVGHRSKRSMHGMSREIHGDARNYLFEAFVRLAAELKPHLVVMENVPGMESARVQNRSFVDLAMARLDACGYRATHWKLDAAAFGVPQERTRIFVVGSLSGLLPARPENEYKSLMETSTDADALPQVTLTDAIFDLPPLAAGEGLSVTRRAVAGADERRTRRYLQKFRLLDSPRVIFNHTTRYNNELDLVLYALLRQGEDSGEFLERTGRRDLMRYRTDAFDDKYMRLAENSPCRTIVAHLAKDGNGYVHPTQTRSLSFREAARVQSFSDSFIFCGPPAGQWIQLGNAVPPVLGEAIARSFSACIGRIR